MRKIDVMLHSLIVWLRVLRWRRANQEAYQRACGTHRELSNKYDRKRWMKR